MSKLLGRAQAIYPAELQNIYGWPSGASKAIICKTLRGSRWRHHYNTTGGPMAASMIIKSRPSSATKETTMTTITNNKKQYQQLPRVKKKEKMTWHNTRKSRELKLKGWQIWVIFHPPWSGGQDTFSQNNRYSIHEEGIDYEEGIDRRRNPK